eukprot:5956413-Amphidinium_carterae.1
MRTIDLERYKGRADTTQVDSVMHSLYMSLLGAVAWLTLTRPDILVYVGRLQRCASCPCLRDVRQLNTVVKWVKRKACVTTYKRLVPPLCLHVSQDSAYRADDDDCLALRAAIVMLSEMRQVQCAVVDHNNPSRNKESKNTTAWAPHGNMHVLEYFSKKQTRVNRGTFGAELNNMLEATDLGLYLNGFFYELLRGPTNPKALHEGLHSGTCPLELHVTGDAHAVFSAIAAPTLAIPNEKQLLYALRAMVDHVVSKRVSRLHRIDTRDMVCDALTKGAVSRNMLLTALVNGSYKIEHADQHHGYSHEGVAPMLLTMSEEDVWQSGGMTVRRVHHVKRKGLFQPSEEFDPPLGLEHMPFRLTQAHLVSGSRICLMDNWIESSG